MNPSDYTIEQRKNIEERVEKAKNLLIDLQLQPAVIVQPVNIGDDVFALKPMPYLQDLRYTSPIQKEQIEAR